MVDVLTHHAQISLNQAAWAVAIPSAVYVLCLWLLIDVGYRKRFALIPGIGVVILLLLSALTPFPVLAAGVILCLYCAYRQLVSRRTF